jgi:hypothetical protein
MAGSLVPLSRLASKLTVASAAAASICEDHFAKSPLQGQVADAKPTAANFLCSKAELSRRRLCEYVAARPLMRATHQAAECHSTALVPVADTECGATGCD